MKNATTIAEGYRVARLLLIVASAVAMTLYLNDPNSIPLSRPTCLNLFGLAWATVIFAGLQNRHFLSRWPKSLVLIALGLEIMTVALIQDSCFRCPVPPRRSPIAHGEFPAAK